MTETSRQPAVLENLDSRILQAVAVLPAAGGALAVLAAWERQGGGWRQAGASVAAAIGRGGFVSPDRKREGDGGTPTGIYPLGTVFGYAPAAATTMPYRQITASDRWVDDPESPSYNRWVHGEPEAASWEEMLRADGLYRHGIVIEYNTAPIVPGKGSAIFIHLWRGPGEPTAGCVALDEADLVRLIGWLAPDKNPVVVLGAELSA